MKGSALPEATVAQAVDYFVLIDYTGGTPVSRRISTASILANLEAGTVIADSAIQEAGVTQHQTALSVTASQVSDFNEAVDDRVAALITTDDDISATYDDDGGTLTIDIGENAVLNGGYF